MADIYDRYVKHASCDVIYADVALLLACRYGKDTRSILRAVKADTFRELLRNPVIAKMSRTEKQIMKKILEAHNLSAQARMKMIDAHVLLKHMQTDEKKEFRGMK